MCPPLYYGIEYEINPWMSRSRQSDPALAQEQWKKLYRLLQDDLGADVQLLEPQKGLPDMVFTANAGLVFANTFVPSRFRHEARRGEEPHFENWFRVRGYEISQLNEEAHFEGEGDMLLCGDFFFAGYHIRSDISALQRVAEIVGREVLPLELTNAWFYHLDTCFCPVSKGAALFYPAAFDAYALKVLEHHIERLIEVPEEEARRFACNAIVIEKNVVMNDGCPATRAKLESLGLAVRETALGEFIKAGGSAKCLVLKVPHDESL
jgi:N-dimethylarginine dimethylaminohydrolase